MVEDPSKFKKMLADQEAEEKEKAAAEEGKKDEVA
jgi:hypothetical protein